MLYIGVDLGTSAVKLLLMDETGEIHNTVTREYPLEFPRPGWSQQNPEDWWDAVSHGIPELLEGFDAGQVAGVGAAGQMHGLVILDEADQVIRPAILWNDGRTAKEVDYLNNVVGRERLSALTANIAFAGFTAPKLLWLRENEPENFARIAKIMLPKDYINYRLTGVHSPEIAALLGIPETAKVAAGAGDNAAAAVGTGVVGEGGCNISLGTSGTVFISSERFGVDRNNALHAFAHADGGYHLMGCMLSAASCNKWLMEDVFHTTDYAGEQAAIREDRLGANHVYFLPYLMGERSPINDTNARGTLLGMTMDTARADLTQAVLEGVAFAIRDSVEVARSLGLEIRSSKLCGGGARSPLWRRILANVLNITLESPASEQGPGMGGAMLAMVAAGAYPDVKTVCEQLVSVASVTEPEPALAEKYEGRYRQFRRIYPACKDLFAALAED